MNFVYQKEGALSTEDCLKIIDSFERDSDEHSPGKVAGDEIVSDIKLSTDLSMDFHDESMVDIIIGKAVSIGVGEYMEFCPGINTLDTPWDVDSAYNIQKYNPGEGFKQWHAESSGYDPIGMKRILAWMIYLNDVDDGGTEFLNQNTVIEAKAGKLCVWPAFFTHVHRSQVSNTKTKYIATGWANYINEIIISK
jgi:hypothetical protein